MSERCHQTRLPPKRAMLAIAMDTPYSENFTHDMSLLPLDSILRLGSGAAGVGCVGMARKVDLFLSGNLENLLEPLANLHQGVLAPGLSCSASPQSDSVECLSHIDDDPHDLVIAFVLQSFANCCKLRMEPHLVDVDRLLVLEGVRPSTSVLVLRVFPLWSDSLLEEMVVGLVAEVRTCRNIILSCVSSIQLPLEVRHT